MEVTVGLVGLKGSGKTTAFGMIEESFDNVKEVTLAGKLKEVCGILFGIDPTAFEDRELKEAQFTEIPSAYLWEKSLKRLYNNQFRLTISEINQLYRIFGIIGRNQQVANVPEQNLLQVIRTPRQLLQYVGTEVLRAIDPDVHIKNAIAGMNGGINVVTDIRFLNEFEYFKNYTKFLPIYISRPEADANFNPETAHRSELEMMGFKDECQLVLNNGDLESLKFSIVSLVDGFISSLNQKRVSNEGV